MTATTPNASCSTAPDGDTRLGQGWERSDEIVGARLSDLIDGIGSIRSFAIPYARLPRRLTVYSEEFPRWVDVADQTPQSLLARPELGAAAVRALIESARDAVRVQRDTVAAGPVGARAAADRLIAQLTDFDRAILVAQLWGLDPVPQRTLAVRLGVSPVSIHRNLRRARARFAELLADPVHHEVSQHAADLRRRLGPYVPASVTDSELRGVGVESSSVTAQLLLHVAGPYARRGQWIETVAVGADRGSAQAHTAVDAVLDIAAAPSTDSLLRALADVGMSPGAALTYLEGRKGLRRFGDAWVQWHGDTAGNAAEAGLLVVGSPATTEVILAAIGSEGITLDTLNAALSHDDRFIRATRRTWGLRAWNITEYVGIAHAIGVHIDASGGAANVDDVVATLLARIPDVAESSIRSYADTLEFVTEAGFVRRRTSSDGWPPVPPLNAVRGAFHRGDNEIRLAVPVTSELLRGSGQLVHPAVATAAGVNPDTRRTFTSLHGQIALYWKLRSTTGASMGSLRAQAVAVGATLNDTVVVALRLGDASVEVTRVRPDDVGTARLQKLLGRTVRNPRAALASSLRCPRHEVAAILRSRGDRDLASMVDGT